MLANFLISQVQKDETRLHALHDPCLLCCDRGQYPFHTVRSTLLWFLEQAQYQARNQARQHARCEAVEGGRERIPYMARLPAPARNQVVSVVRRLMLL
jgi:hypothetical protein